MGFVAFGVADAGAAPKTASRLRAWLEQGRHGDMIWMAETEERRGSPRALWQDVRSVIMLGVSYAPGEDPLRLADEPAVGRISVYAQGEAYSDVGKRRPKEIDTRVVGETARP